MTEGELWTREVVGELRASGYRLRAWSLFIARSRERASLARRDRRGAHRETLALAVLGLAAWLVLALLGRPWLALVGATWWMLVVLMLDWHLGMLEDEAGRRSARLGVPNLLTLLRAALVPALPVLSPALLLVALIGSGIADVLDGAIARSFGEETRLGAWLDGGVDGFVLGAAALGAGVDGVLPWWAVAIVLVRHALQWAVVGAAWLTIAELPVRRRPVSGKVPGALLFAGLALACLRVPGASALVAVGSIGGLASFGLTLSRTRHQPLP
jgi:phosphatidylglycerophosphate synthase